MANVVTDEKEKQRIELLFAQRSEPKAVTDDGEKERIAALFDSAPAPVAPAPEPEPSVVDRIFGQPLERAQERFLGTMERATGLGAPSLEQQLADPAALEQANRMQQGLGSTFLQIAGAPVQLAFDVASQGIIVGAEAGFGLLPESTREGVSEFFMGMVNTPEGQAALEAASNGVDAYNEWKEGNPEAAANIESGLDIFGGMPKNLVQNNSIDLKPLIIERVGFRNVTKPLEGIDKDIYNIAYAGDKKTLAQAENTTDPQGLLRTQKQLATDEQLETVDILRGLGVRGSRTSQENFNAMIRGLDGLDDKLIAATRKYRRNIDPSRFRQNLDAEIQGLQEQFPDLFMKNGKPDPAIRNAFERAYARMTAKLDEQGPSAEGLVAARRAFDNEMSRAGIELGTDKLGIDVLSSRAARNAVNKTLFEVVPEAEDLLGQMSKVLDVWDTVGMKAAREPATMLGRYVSELGLSHLLGESIASRLMNGAYLLGLSPVLVPAHLIKRGMMMPTPAVGRAKVAYVVRDIKQEIDKALKSMTPGGRKRELLASKPAIYSALDAAAKQLMLEEEE